VGPGHLTQACRSRRRQFRRLMATPLEVTPKRLYLEQILDRPVSPSQISCADSEAASLDVFTSCSRSSVRAGFFRVDCCEHASPQHILNPCDLCTLLRRNEFIDQNVSEFPWKMGPHLPVHTSMYFRHTPVPQTLVRSNWCNFIPV
jgi:hypothetical protein